MYPEIAHRYKRQDILSKEKEHIQLLKKLSKSLENVANVSTSYTHIISPNSIKPLKRLYPKDYKRVPYVNKCLMKYIASIKHTPSSEIHIMPMKRSSVFLLPHRPRLLVAKKMELNGSHSVSTKSIKKPTLKLVLKGPTIMDIYGSSSVGKLRKNKSLMLKPINKQYN